MEKKEALLRIAGPTIAIAVFMGLGSFLIFKQEAIDEVNTFSKGAFLKTR